MHLISCCFFDSGTEWERNGIVGTNEIFLCECRIGRVNFIDWFHSKLGREMGGFLGIPIMIDSMFAIHMWDEGWWHKDRSVGIFFLSLNNYWEFYSRRQICVTSQLWIPVHVKWNSLPMAGLLDRYQALGHRKSKQIFALLESAELVFNNVRLLYEKWIQQCIAIC